MECACVIANVLLRRQNSFMVFLWDDVSISSIRSFSFPLSISIPIPIPDPIIRMVGFFRLFSFYSRDKIHFRKYASDILLRIV